MGRNFNRVSDEGGKNSQNAVEQRERTDGGGSQTVSREARGGAAKEGHGSGNKSGGDGKKG